MSKSSRDSSTSCQTLQRDKNTDLSIFSSLPSLFIRQLYLRLSYFPKVVNNFKFSFSFNPPCKDRAHEGKARERLFHSPRIVNYRSNSPSISETWAHAIDSSPSPRLLPIVSRGAHIAIPVIIHRWLTVPRGHNRECLSGAASAVAALIYLPPPFPILSVRATLTSTTRWYFTVTTDASEPVVVPGIRLPTDTGYRELRTMQGPSPPHPSSPVLFLAQFRPGDHLCRFPTHWVIGRREATLLSRREHGQVVERVWACISLWHSGWYSNIVRIK